MNQNEKRVSRPVSLPGGALHSGGGVRGRRSRRAAKNRGENTTRPHPAPRRQTPAQPLVRDLPCRPRRLPLRRGPDHLPNLGGCSRGRHAPRAPDTKGGRELSGPVDHGQQRFNRVSARQAQRASPKLFTASGAAARSSGHPRRLTALRERPGRQAFPPVDSRLGLSVAQSDFIALRTEN